MKRVLIVEDQESNRELLVQLLVDDYDLDVASDGREALRRAASCKPDVVLLDLSLPGLDGWAVARRLKEDPATRAIPVVALTAHAMTGDRDAALEAGCDEYLTKPIEEDMLFAVLARFLGGHKA